MQGHVNKTKQNSRVLRGNTQMRAWFPVCPTPYLALSLSTRSVSLTTYQLTSAPGTPDKTCPFHCKHLYFKPCNYCYRTGRTESPLSYGKQKGILTFLASWNYEEHSVFTWNLLQMLNSTFRRKKWIDWGIIWMNPYGYIFWAIGDPSL